MWLSNIRYAAKGCWEITLIKPNQWWDRRMTGNYSGESERSISVERLRFPERLQATILVSSQRIKTWEEDHTEQSKPQFR